jgi:hypothetical protein
MRDSIRLHSLNGKPAPAGLGADLRRIGELSARAKEQLWQVLLPSLVEPLPAEMESTLDRFCATHAVSADVLAPILKAARFLLREAGLVDLDALSFAIDVAMLSNDDAEVERVLLSRFEQAKRVVRADLRTLLDHGNTLTGINWRLDRVAACDSGARDALVAQLTLSYHDGRTPQRLTLQVPPQLLRELRAVCDRLLV